MMKLKRRALNLAAALTLALSVGLAAPVYAAGGSSCPSDQTAKGQVLQGLEQTGSNCDTSQVNTTLQTIVSLLSLVVGIVSVIVIVIAGFKYIVSSGDQNKVSNAKSTLIYAMVGLAVAALAQVLVHFVLFQTTKT